MAFQSRLRCRQGLWWWTLDLRRPRRWHGPWRSREEANQKVSDHIMDVMSSSFFGRSCEVPLADLRQEAWRLWPELR
jgi:hypothetical protein